MLTPTGYIRWFLISAATGLALVFAFTSVIDPLGISPLRYGIPGLNLHKPLRANFDRLVKPFDVSKKFPRTIFLGSSLVKQSIDPAWLDGSPFAPAYNAGIDMGVDPEETKRLMEYYFAVDHNIRTVYIELFLTAILNTPIVAPQPSVDRIALQKERILALISGSAFRYSLATIQFNRAVGVPPLVSFDKGFVPAPPATSRFSVDNIPDHIYRQRVINSSLKASMPYVEAVREIVELCRRHQVDCRFFISPLHADVLYGIHFAGLWDELVVLKKAFAQIAPVYDFTRYNNLIDERSGPIKYWGEAFHFSPALGAEMVRIMTGERPADLPANFGVLLNSGNVDAELQAWTLERDRWISRYPLIRARFEAARNNNLKASDYTGTLYELDGKLAIGEAAYKIVRRGAGVVDYVSIDQSYALGWAGDVVAREAARAVAIFQGERLVVYVEPNIPRPEISTDMAASLSFAGFYTTLSNLVIGNSTPQLRAFSVYDDGTASELEYAPAAAGFRTLNSQVQR